MEANQSWSSQKSHWEPQAQNPAVQHELLGPVLLEALSNWTMGTDAHLGIKVGAFVSWSLCLSWTSGINPSLEFKLYRPHFIHNFFWDDSTKWCLFCLKSKANKKTNFRAFLFTGWVILEFVFISVLFHVYWSMFFLGELVPTHTLVGTVTEGAPIILLSWWQFYNLIIVIFYLSTKCFSQLFPEPSVDTFLVFTKYWSF